MDNSTSHWYRQPVIILAAGLSIIVWIIAFAFTSYAQNQLFDETANRARQIAVFFESHTIGIFQYGDAYLKQVRREYLRNYDLADVENLMSEVPLDNSIVSHVTIIDEKGTPILVSGHKIKPGSTAKDREYFQFQKNSQADELLISQPHTGRNSGKLIVRLVRRYERPNGVWRCHVCCTRNKTHYRIL